MYSFFKRLLDIVLSLTALIVLAPLLLVLALLVKLDSPGPALFKQKRVGRNEKLFDIYKFRSMYTSAPRDVATSELQNAESHITRVGRVLRKTSLDELPQIYNILAGQMSVIGPRPALYNQYDLIDARDKVHANDIRPGLTGLAQINGRDELEIPEKARLDGEYVRRLSFGFDLRCLIGTVFSVVRHEGVVEGGTGALKR